MSEYQDPLRGNRRIIGVRPRPDLVGNASRSCPHGLLFSFASNHVTPVVTCSKVHVHRSLLHTCAWGIGTVQQAYEARRKWFSIVQHRVPAQMLNCRICIGHPLGNITDYVHTLWASRAWIISVMIGFAQLFWCLLGSIVTENSSLIPSWLSRTTLWWWIFAPWAWCGRIRMMNTNTPWGQWPPHSPRPSRNFSPSGPVVLVSHRNRPFPLNVDVPSTPIPAAETRIHLNAPTRELD
jgi:hypothetical protein